MTAKPHISVVSPVYRAEDCLRELHRRLVAELETITADFELVLVDDASPDGSWAVIEEIAARDPRVRGFQLSRNFGQHYGITAGLDQARGDWVVILDCDLQDRPEEVHRLYAEAQKGFDVVLARRVRRQDTFYRRFASASFYTVFNYLTGIRFDKDVAGFCILGRNVVDAVCSLREKDRFLMGFVQWVGFRVGRIEVEHADRFAGRTSYTIGRLLRLAWDTSLAFSNRPLHFAVRLGFGMSFLSLLAAGYVLWLAAHGGTAAAMGWASIAVSLWFLAGLIIANLGVVGIYVGKTFDQTKQRPLYVIGRTTGPGLAHGPVDSTRRTGAGIERSPGHVFWITGLAGSGKTTVSHEVYRLLLARGGPVVRLDGDGFREVMGNDLGHDMDDRLRNAERISRMCRYLSDQGIDVVCATQSLFASVHRWNREHIPNYHEVYLKVSPETLARRDQKGLYSRSSGPGAAGVVGIDQPFDEPEHPDLVIPNEDGAESQASAAERIVALVGEA